MNHPYTSPLIVIPSRLASTRLPQKPLELIAGKPLIVRVLERLQGLTDWTRLVATDDVSIARVVEAAGGQAVMTSPQCLSGLDRVAEVALSHHAPAYINVQGDEPLVEPEAIRRLVRAFEEEPALPLATLVAPLQSLEAFLSPHVVKVVVDEQDRALYFSRAPIPHPREGGGVPAGALQHLGIYGYRRETLLALAASPEAPLERIEKLEQLRALQAGIPIRVLRVKAGWPGVDTPEDLARVNRLWREQVGD